MLKLFIHSNVCGQIEVVVSFCFFYHHVTLLANLLFLIMISGAC